MPLVTSVNQNFLIHKFTQFRTLPHDSATSGHPCRHRRCTIKHPVFTIICGGSLGRRTDGCLALDRPPLCCIGSGVRTHYKRSDSLHYTHMMGLQTLYCIRVLDRPSLLHYTGHCSLCHYTGHYHYHYEYHCLCAFGLVH